MTKLRIGALQRHSFSFCSSASLVTEIALVAHSCAFLTRVPIASMPHQGIKIFIFILVTSEPPAMMPWLLTILCMTLQHRSGRELTLFDFVLLCWPSLRVGAVIAHRSLELCSALDHFADTA